MGIKDMLSESRPIKNKSSVKVLAVSSDDEVQFTDLKPLRQFLVVDLDEDKNDEVWGIDKLRPFHHMDGRVDWCQMILEDACVAQRTNYEPIYENEKIALIRNDIYHRTKNKLERDKQKLLAAKYMQWGIGAIVVIFIAAMALS